MGAKMEKGVTRKCMLSDRFPCDNLFSGERGQMEALFDRIRELKTEYAADYTWGVRFDSPGLPVGHVFQRSRVWIDGDPTDELLAGTSVLTEPRPGYESLGQAYIVCGFLVGSGEDRGEALLTECEVMEV